MTGRQEEKKVVKRFEPCVLGSPPEKDHKVDWLGMRHRQNASNLYN